jgi:hypothetical protein
MVELKNGLVLEWYEEIRGRFCMNEWTERGRETGQSEKVVLEN